MSVQVRYRREAASFLASFVGAQGELLIDTTNNRVQVHDGTTPGGFPAAKLSEVVTNTRTAVANANYAAQASDRTIAYTSLSASRTVTLPAASAFPTGTQLLVVDESGACSASRTLTIARAGSDTINGAASATIAAAYGYLALASNGLARWTIVDQPGAASVVNNFAATAYPGSANDASQGYGVGSRWLIVATGEMFFCRDATVGAAVWSRAENADFFGYVAGNWYLPIGVSSYGSGGTQTANRAYFYPFIIKQRCTLAALGVRVTTTASGGNVQVAIYAADSTSKRPSGTTLCVTPSMSTAAATSVSGAISCQLEPGLYWMAVNSDNTTVLYVGVSSASISSQQVIGSTNESNVPPSATAGPQFYAAQTFGTWADMTGTTLLEGPQSANYAPLVHFKIGSVP